jgi:hypothetical protein
MRTHRPARSARAPFLALLAVALLAVAPAASAQTFALGAGGGVVNDTETLKSIDDFSTGAGYAYLEAILQPGVHLQGRYTRMTLPPAAEGGFDADVDAATLTVAYLFNEGWWRAGFVGGVGAYFEKSKTVGLDQVPRDTSESVFGWNGGLLTVFTVNRRWDVRLEAVWHLIQDEAKRKPLVVSAAVSWKF